MFRLFLFGVFLILFLSGCGNEISFYKRGVYFENKGEYAKALSSYRNSIKRDSTYALSYMGIGSVMVKNKRWEEALLNLLKANELGINDQELNMMIGQVYESLNQMDKAAEAYGKAIKERPEDALLHLKLGDTLEKKRDYEGALKEYNSAIAIAIDFPEAYFHSARMLVKLGKFKEAEETYLSAIKIKKDYVDAQNNLTALYIDTKQITKAMNSAKKTLETDGGFVTGIINMGIVYELKGLKNKAGEYYRKAIKKDNSNGFAHFKYAMNLIDLNKIEDAAKELKLAINFSPDFPPAYNELSLISLDNGNYNEALNNLKKALEIDSTYSTAYYNMGHILANMGKYNEAASAYKKYLLYAHNPEDSLSVKTKINILSDREK